MATVTYIGVLSRAKAAWCTALLISAKTKNRIFGVFIQNCDIRII